MLHISRQLHYKLEVLSRDILCATLFTNMTLRLKEEELMLVVHYCRPLQAVARLIITLMTQMLLRCILQYELMS